MLKPLVRVTVKFCRKVYELLGPPSTNIISPNPPPPPPKLAKLAPLRLTTARSSTCEPEKLRVTPVAPAGMVKVKSATQNPSNVPKLPPVTQVPEPLPTLSSLRFVPSLPPLPKGVALETPALGMDTVKVAGPVLRSIVPALSGEQQTGRVTRAIVGTDLVAVMRCPSGGAPGILPGLPPQLHLLRVRN